MTCFQDEASSVLKIRQLISELQEFPSNEKLMKKYKTEPAIIEDFKKQKEILRSKISEMKALTVTYGGNKVPSAVKRVYVMKCPGE